MNITLYLNFDFLTNEKPEKDLYIFNVRIQCTICFCFFFVFFEFKFFFCFFRIQIYFLFFSNSNFFFVFFEFKFFFVFFEFKFFFVFFEFKFPSNLLSRR